MIAENLESNTTVQFINRIITKIFSTFMRMIRCCNCCACFETDFGRKQIRYKFCRFKFNLIVCLRYVFLKQTYQFNSIRFFSQKQILSLLSFDVWDGNSTKAEVRVLISRQGVMFDRVVWKNVSNLDHRNLNVSIWLHWMRELYRILRQSSTNLHHYQAQNFPEKKTEKIVNFRKNSQTKRRMLSLSVFFSRSLSFCMS